LFASRWPPFFIVGHFRWKIDRVVTATSGRGFGVEASFCRDDRLRGPKLPEGLVANELEALFLEPAVEALLVGGSSLAVGRIEAVHTPGFDAADDLGDAALGEAVLGCQFGLAAAL
jgi:hypothetical protein